MLRIFNSLNKKKEIFESINNNKVNIYVCGVTLSNNCHIGHGRTFYFFDILIRYLIHLGYKCNYIRNITDINNEIIDKSSNKENNFKKLIFSMIKFLNNDLTKLEIIKPNLEPLVSENIEFIINSIDFLIKTKNAYISLNGDVLFSISSFKKYNCFFKNRKFNTNIINDFVLWKLNNLNDNIGWLSPWGLGRPGWHIECSVISNRYLLNNIDIHGGGNDLIFPHHENEIAISKCLFGSKYISKYWIHTGLVLLNNKKMSKSKNNFFLLYNVLKKYNPEVLKFFFMSTHYRKNLFYDKKILKKIKFSVNRLYLSLCDLNLSVSLSKQDIVSFKSFDNSFYEFMDDDLNIPKVFSLFFNIVSEINKFKNKNFLLASKLGVKIRYLANIIGLLNYKSNLFLKDKKKILCEKKNFFLIKKINKLIKLRNLLRKSKNWIKADIIKEKLLKLGVNLIDKNNFTDWYFK